MSLEDNERRMLAEIAADFQAGRSVERVELLRLLKTERYAAGYLSDEEFDRLVELLQSRSILV